MKLKDKTVVVTGGACWDIHVMAHVYAARAVLPSMVERGEGYFVQMASAAILRGYPRDESIEIATDECVLQRTNTSIRLRILA